MRARLVPVNGGKPIVINRDITVVGRQHGVCDVIIERSSISKLHCMVVRTDGLLFIRDLGSTNGTKVNGQQILRGALLPGDELSFASERYKVEMGPGRDEVDERQYLTEAIPIFEADPDNEFFAPDEVIPAMPVIAEQTFVSNAKSAPAKSDPVELPGKKPREKNLLESSSDVRLLTKAEIEEDEHAK